MKKAIMFLTSLLFAFALFNFNSSTAQAASTPVKLTTGQKQVTSSGISVTSKLGFSVNNTGNKIVHFDVLRNGSIVKSGGNIQPGKYVSVTDYNWPKGTYTLKIYCGPRFSLQTGCNAQGNIGN